MRKLLTALILFVLVAPVKAQMPTTPSGFDNNADSVAVVIGNRNYKQTVPVDFAENDAEAIKAYLVGSLGFRDQNVFLLKDATLSELNQMLGTDSNPQSGRLWRSVSEGKSNVFVFYSGHGVPDLSTHQPFLLPQDGNPNQSESGYQLQTLYRNLDLVKQKIGPNRQLIVMIDACFTGETGRKGESLMAMSAPGFMPAKPKTAGDIIKLVATSGATPANWDEQNKLGLFTSRFLMGVSGLARDAARPGDASLIPWQDLQAYVKGQVKATALRDTGREQVPEIDAAPIVLKASVPVPAVQQGVALAQDQTRWERAEKSGTREAFELYVGQCGPVCAYRDRAMSLLLQLQRSAEATQDEENWKKLGALGQYQAYLDSCRSVCAYRSIAEGYLGRTDANRDPKVKECDELASDPHDPDKPRTVKGVPMRRIEARAAIAACQAATQAHPELPRLSYALGRAFDKVERYKDAMAAYKIASDAGSNASLNNLAALYEMGQGTKPMLTEAFAMYMRAAEAGNVTAMTNVARMLLYGRGTPKSEAAAVHWYQKAAETGNAAAITMLMPYYINGGPGIPKDPQKGFTLFKKSVDEGDPVAMATIAVLIDNGFGSFFPGTRSFDMAMRALKQGESGAAAIAATDTSARKLKPETIAALQRAIQTASFYTGAVDGQLNPMFVRSLDSYARSVAEQD